MEGRGYAVGMGGKMGLNVKTLHYIAYAFPACIRDNFLRHDKIVLDRLNVVDIVLKCICIFYASALRCKPDPGTSTEGTIRPGFPISLPENKMFLRVFLPRSAVKEGGGVDCDTAWMLRPRSHVS